MQLIYEDRTALLCTPRSEEASRVTKLQVVTHAAAELCARVFQASVRTAYAELPSSLASDEVLQCRAAGKAGSQAETSSSCRAD